MDSAQDNLNGRRNPDTGVVNRQNNRLPETNNVVSPDNASGTARDTDASSGFTRVAPNESRRRQLQMIAQKGEEDLQRLRDSRRAVPIDEPPELLGGCASLAEVRQKQQALLDQSRIQKKLKKMDMDKRRRAEEDEENQRLKDEQRKKAELHEMRTRQQEQQRRQQLRPEQVRVTESFLQDLECKCSFPATSNSRSQTHPPHGSRENEGRRGAESSGLHLKKKEQTLPAPQGQTLQDDPRERNVGSGREQADHRMLNSAFLDRLEGRGRVADASAFRDSGRWESRRSEPPQRPVAPPTPEPPQSDARWPESTTAIDPDYERVVRKLETLFPECSRMFLEDILIQCNGDCQQASALLCDTMG